MSMNVPFQISNMKFQIKNIDIQLENLSMQISNPNFGIQINNIGIQLLNLGIQMFNIGVTITNLNQMEINNINNIIMELKNISNQNLQNEMEMNQNEMEMNQNVMGMNQNIMGMNPMNNGFDDDDWMKGFKMGVKEMNTIEVLFKTTNNKTTILSLDKETTADEMLKQYFTKIGKSFLLNDIGYIKENIDFLYNAGRIYFNEDKIENIFASNHKPTILVNDINNILG